MNMMIFFSIFFVNADAFIENPNNFSLSKFLLSVSPTRRAECAEHCNYFVQYLVSLGLLVEFFCLFLEQYYYLLKYFIPKSVLCCHLLKSCHWLLQMPL